jgi:hypothetical protein
VTFATYKIQPRNISLEKADLKKLIDYVGQKVKETRDRHKNETKFEGQSEQDKASILKTLDDAYQTATFFYAPEGEELLVYDSAIIDAPEFPERLTRFTIDTFIPFRNRTGLAPRNGIRIDLDFSSSKIMDYAARQSSSFP